MANLNRVMLIGRLTRDVETRAFQGGGKVASFGFCTNNRKKVNGQWADDPVFLDVKAFNREHGRKLADLVEETFAKGKQVYLEGHLVLEQWEKDGQKRSKLVIFMDDFQYLDAKEGGGKPQRQSEDQEDGAIDMPSSADGEDIPF